MRTRRSCPAAIAARRHRCRSAAHGLGEAQGGLRQPGAGLAQARPARLAAADDMGFAHGERDLKRPLPRVRKRPFQNCYHLDFERHHPGEGRGPIGKVSGIVRSALLATFPSWAPAFAGVVRVFAGENLCLVLPRRREPSLDSRLRGENASGSVANHRRAEQDGSQGIPNKKKAASSAGEAAFSVSARHGQSPCRRPRRAAPAGLGRVLHQLGAGLALRLRI